MVLYHIKFNKYLFNDPTTCFTSYIMHTYTQHTQFPISPACQANQFTCTARNSDNTPQCIASSARCDSNNDCKDKSDEAGCGKFIHKRQTVFTILPLLYDKAIDILTQQTRCMERRVYMISMRIQHVYVVRAKNSCTLLSLFWIRNNHCK